MGTTMDMDTPMPEPIRVEPREGYRIYVEYDDGACGEVDLSHNAGKGVFKVWDEPGVFERVHITEDGRDWVGQRARYLPGCRLLPADRQEAGGDDARAAARSLSMPELCRFHGAKIMINLDDHDPPHFHVRHGNRRMRVGIAPVLILNGSLPPNIERLVLEWARRAPARTPRGVGTHQKPPRPRQDRTA